jgi:hypothetical protein
MEEHEHREPGAQLAKREFQVMVAAPTGPATRARQLHADKQRHWDVPAVRQVSASPFPELVEMEGPDESDHKMDPKLMEFLDPTEGL